MVVGGQVARWSAGLWAMGMVIVAGNGVPCERPLRRWDHGGTQICADARKSGGSPMLASSGPRSTTYGGAVSAVKRFALSHERGCGGQSEHWNRPRSPGSLCAANSFASTPHAPNPSQQRAKLRL